VCPADGHSASSWIQHYSDQPFLPNEVLSATWQHVTDGCGSTAYKSVTIDQGGLDNVEDLYRVIA